MSDTESNNDQINPGSVIAYSAKRRAELSTIKSELTELTVTDIVICVKDKQSYQAVFSSRKIGDLYVDEAVIDIVMATLDFLTRTSKKSGGGDEQEQKA